MLKFLGYLLQLIISPARGWEDIAARGEEPRAIASSGFYPLIGITACTVFIQRFYVSSLSLVTMIQNVVVTFVQYFVTFFFAVFLFSFFLKRMVDGEPNEKKYTTFILYNLGLLAVINIIGNCLPPIDLSIVQFLPVVVVLVMWMGMRYLAVRATSSFAFTALSVVSILLPPYILGCLFHFIMQQLS